MAKKIFTNESFTTLINEIKSYVTNMVSTKSDKEHEHNDKYYTKSEIDGLELISTNDIDVICGSEIYSASEVKF